MIPTSITLCVKSDRQEVATALARLLRGLAVFLLFPLCVHASDNAESLGDAAAMAGKPRDALGHFMQAWRGTDSGTRDVKEFSLRLRVAF
jgi:hypothetical protein